MAAIERTASAVWKGDLKGGSGKINSNSGVLHDTEYTYAQRFENAPGTNPEELIAAAHASCFSMALSAQLGAAGMTAQNISTTATVTLEKVGDGFSVTASHLETRVKIPGADRNAFNKAAEDAKSGCPISKLLAAKITMEARLEA